MVASEDTFDSAGLAELGARVRAGGPVDLDPDAVASLEADLARTPVAPLGFAALLIAVPVGVLVGLLLLAASLLGG